MANNSEKKNQKDNYLINLILTYLTYGLTIWLIWTVVGWIDGFVLPLVPKAYHPDRMLQDFLGLGSEARINTPGTTSDNWRWRMEEGALDSAMADHVAAMVEEASRRP